MCGFVSDDRSTHRRRKATARQERKVRTRIRQPVDRTVAGNARRAQA
jgi:hypothetical protein